VLKTHGRTGARAPSGARTFAGAWARLCARATVILAAAAFTSCAPRDRDPHADVACAGCHRGVVADTGRATVTLASCDRAGCHAEVRADADTARMAMVRFTHRAHGADSGVTAVPCATCHTHTDGSTAMVTDSAACALCHAPEILAGSKPQCLSCHPDPMHTRQTSQGVPIAHGEIQDARIPCTRCHYDLLDGRPGQAAAGCRDCHRDTVRTRPALRLLDSLGARRAPPARDTAATLRYALDRGRIAALADTLHRGHLGYTCSACHAPVRHRVVAMSTTVALACGDCHASRHRRPIPEDTIPSARCDDCHEGTHAQEQRLILGLLPDEPIRPSPMFMGGVTCRSCHVRPGAPTLRPGQSLVATEGSCTGCHGAQWHGYLGLWQRGYQRREGWALRYIEGAERVTADSALPSSARVRVRRAKTLMAFLRAAGPLHNLPASDRIMRDAVDLAAQAYEAAGRAAPVLPEFGPPVRTGTCISCHYGVEELRADRDTVTGRQFTHGDHMVRGGLACDNCHAAGAAPPGIPDTLWIDTTRTDRGPRRRADEERLDRP
jgi:hypothetical protein